MRVTRGSLAKWVVGSAVVAALGWPTPVEAQTGAGAGSSRLSVNGFVQTGTVPLSEALTLTKNAEPAPISASAPRAAAPGFDIGGAAPVWRNVGASLALSYVTRSADADVSARIPHPFYFDQPRAIAGRVSNIGHSELAVHLDGAVLFPRERLDVVLVGGLSIVHLAQDLIADVTYADAYPYDTARFVEAKRARVAATKAGYNAGLDVGWALTPRWGFGALVRYVHARVPLTVDGRGAGTRDVGGLQAGGGLRVRF